MEREGGFCKDMAIKIIDTYDEHGGIIRNIIDVDISGDTVTPSVLAAGYTAHDADGNLIVGTASFGQNSSQHSEDTYSNNSNGGFSFDGVDIAEFGLEYAPENQNTYVYNPGNYNVHEQKFDGHDGGYFYGTTVQPKDFVLRCIYEDVHINSGVMERIHEHFRRGKTAKLIFSRRPWCWYTATVVSVDTKQMMNYQNGVVTITLRAYYPYARSDYDVIPENSEYEKMLLKSTGLLYEGAWTPHYEYATEQNPIVADTTIYLYNPGTERAKVAIRIGGDVGRGVSIANRTTGQNCRFVAISPTTCPGNTYVQSDALNGQTVKVNGNIVEPGFLYHDQGFIDLDPGFPAVRDLRVTVQNGGGTVVESYKNFKEDMVGKYIRFVDGTYARIVRFIDDSTVEVNKTLDTVQNGKAMILKMNEIYISSDPSGGNFNITKLDFIYKPTYA